MTVNNQKDANLDFIFDSIKITSDKHDGYLALKTNNSEAHNLYRVRLYGESSIVGSSSKKSKDVLSSKASLEFYDGGGKLSVTGKYKNGITCDDILSVDSGVIIEVTLDRKEAAASKGYNQKGFGIKAENGFSMRGGKVLVHAVDGIDQYESRGIKVDGSDKSPKGYQNGYIHISDGELFIESDSKALSAGWDMEKDAKTQTTDDDPWPDVEISGGRVEVITKGEPRGRRFGPPGGNGDFKMPESFDENGNPVMPDMQNPPQFPDDQAQNGENKLPPERFKNVTAFKSDKDKTDESGETKLSPEGIEAKRNLTISGGTVIVHASDDGLNAGKLLTISGGEVYVVSTSNDAIDCNEKIVISGGKTVAFGTTMPDGALDADFDNNVVFTGGLLVALGGANNSPQGEGSKKEKFVSIDLVENAFGGMPPFGDFDGGQMGQKPGDAAPGQNPANTNPDESDTTNIPKNMNKPPMFGMGKHEKSELAGAVIAVAESGKSDVLAAIKVPADFTGGGSLLVLSEYIQKDIVYQAYKNPDMTIAEGSWINDALFTGKATVSGEPVKEGKGGDVGQRHGPGGMGGPGGHGGGMGRPGGGHGGGMGRPENQELQAD